MGEMGGLDRWLGLWRWRALKLLVLLLLLLLLMWLELMVLLLMVHPRGGAVGIVGEPMTPLWWQMEGPRYEGLPWLVRARALWTAWPHAREKLSLALGVLMREGGVRGVGSTEHAAEGGRLGTG